MGKVSLNPGTLLAPLPAVMVSCSNGKEDNIITIAWTGIINSDPAMTYISVRPERHSYGIIKESGEFVINLVGTELLYACDYCGCRSGRDEDKFANMHLTKATGQKVSCPLIAESPLSLECKVTGIEHLGSHDMFKAEIVAVDVNEELLDENGRLALEKADLVAYVHGEYYPLFRKRAGKFGYSVMKPKTAKKRREEGKSAGGKQPHWKKPRKE